MLVNGPYSLITTAVSADLGMHQSIKGIIYINEIKVISRFTIWDIVIFFTFLMFAFFLYDPHVTDNTKSQH